MGTGNLASVEQDRFGHAVVAQRPDTEIVVHIDENLGENRRDDLKLALESLTGVKAAEFCASRFHLMLIAYDAEVTSSRAILDQVLRQGLHAQLIGPM